MRRYRDKLYCEQTVWNKFALPEGRQAAQEFLQDIVWPAGQSSIMIGNDQTLSCVPSSAGILREQWQNAKVEVKVRRGGEKICLPGRTRPSFTEKAVSGSRHSTVGKGEDSLGLPE